MRKNITENIPDRFMPPNRWVAAGVIIAIALACWTLVGLVVFSVM